MRLMRSAVLAGLGLTAAACATSTATTTTVSGTPVVQAVPAVDPAGRWGLTLMAQGQNLDLVMELTRRTGNEFGGTITSQVFPPIDIAKATLTGDRLLISATAPTGDVATLNLVIAGDVLDGEWSMAGDGSRVRGRRL